MAGVAERVERKLRRACRIGDIELPGDFVLPSYDGYGLANVSPTVLKHFGAKIETPGLADEVVGKHLNGVKKVVVVLLEAHRRPGTGPSDPVAPSIRSIDAPDLRLPFDYCGCALYTAHRSATDQSWDYGIPNVSPGPGCAGEHDSAEPRVR